MEIRKRLIELADEKYRNFEAPLIPSVDKNRIIGVRTPQLRALAKEIWGTPEADEFIACPSHYYYDEMNLHAFLIELYAGDYEKCLSLLFAFLPHIDNWATCDMMRPKFPKDNIKKLCKQTFLWLDGKTVYERRYGIVTHMRYYLSDEYFSPEGMERISLYESDEYYVAMAAAWYWAEALYMKREKALPYFLSGELNGWIHDKALQKAVESRRFTPDEKDYFRSLKI